MSVQDSQVLRLTEIAKNFRPAPKAGQEVSLAEALSYIAAPDATHLQTDSVQQVKK